MIKRPIILVDVETSGLDEDENEVIEIYATAMNYWDLSDHHAGPFHAYIKPERPETAQADAIRIVGSGWTKACSEGLQAKVVWQNFKEYVDSINPGNGYATAPVVFAWNQDFDRKFITKAMIKHKIVTKGKFGYEWPWAWMFDAMDIAYFLFNSDPSVYDLKMQTILAKAGLKRDNADVHAASEDVELMKQWMRRALKFGRECNQRMKMT